VSETQKKHLKIAIYIALAIFGICSIISLPNSFRDFSAYTGISVSITIFISVLYEKWFWKLNPLEKTPKLFNHYNGILEYNYNGEFGNKNIKVYVRQSLFRLNIQLITDEGVSSTITSKVVEENGNYVVYYTYITNPKSKFSERNPIHYGTCRFIVDDPAKLSGFYWTSRNTKGDIYLDIFTESEDRKDKKLVGTFL